MNLQAKGQNVLFQNEANERQDTLGLLELLSLLAKHWLTLLCLPAAFGLTGLYYALAQAPIYRATAWLQVDPNPIRAVSELNEVYDPGFGKRYYYNTQQLILTSRKLSLRLIERMQLNGVQEFVRPNTDLRRQIWLKMSVLPLIPAPPPLSEPSESDMLEIMLNRVQSAISVSLSPGSTMFEVSFSSEDPKLAADAANALADLYIEELLEARLEIYRKATLWLTEKLGGISSSLKQSESELQSFRDAADIVNVGGARGLLEEELRDLSARLRQAQRETTALESTFTEIHRAGNNPDALTKISALLIDPVIKEATERYLSAKNRLDTLRKRYGDRHPQMTTAKASLETTQEAYLTQLQMKAGSIESEYNIARRNQQQMSNQVDAVRLRLKELDRKQFELGQLQREVSSNQQLYDLFLSRFKEIQNSSSSAEINARIADEAFPPKSKFSPNTRRIVILATLIGATLAMLVIALRELLNMRVENSADLEQISALPVIGAVPSVTPGRRLRSAAHYLASNPKTPFAESVRSIKSAIALNLIDTSQQVITITSTIPGEGKTTLTAALAAALASNESVLVIDSDMRRSRLAQQFGNLRSPPLGLVSLLTGETDLEAAIKHDEATKVDYLPAGQSPANPALLLDSIAFKNLMQQLRKRYRFIIVDTPPIGASSDALHLLSETDGVVLVARTDTTRKDSLRASLKQLTLHNAPLLGLVLNATQKKREKAYGHYGYY